MPDRLVGADLAELVLQLAPARHPDRLERAVLGVHAGDAALRVRDRLGEPGAQPRGDHVGVGALELRTACGHPVQQVGEPVPVEPVEGGLLRAGLPHGRGDDGVLQLVR